MYLHFPIFSKEDFVFFRLFGPGFGNLLFPLYRAFQAQKAVGGQLVFPQFFQIKPGPFLRIERDKRTYVDLFKSRNLREIALHLQALFANTVVSEDSVDYSEMMGHHDKIVVIRYEGLKNYFLDLELEHLPAFSDYLLTRSAFELDLRVRLEQIGIDDICVHLRRGDFTAESVQGSTAGGMNYRISDDWYVTAVEKARKKFPSGRVRVFTDASHVDPELMDRLNCHEIDQSRNALHALMRMSAHGAIIASKSSFSLWSALLGRQYLYIHETFDLGRYLPVSRIQYERV